MSDTDFEIEDTEKKKGSRLVRMAKSMYDFVVARPKLKKAVVYTGSAMLALTLYHGVLGQFLDNEREDFDFSQVKPPEGGSYAIATAADLLEHEVNKHWHPSDTILGPCATLEDTPAFQEGVQKAIGAFVTILRDKLARNSSGENEIDEDIKEAYWRAVYPPDKFLFGRFDSANNYEKAAEYLRTFNKKLHDGDKGHSKTARYDLRSDNIFHLLDRITTDLNDELGMIHRAYGEDPFVGRINERHYYHARGFLYGTYMILQAIQKDAKKALTYSTMENPYEDLLDVMKDILSHKGPIIVVNSDKDSAFWGCNLYIIGSDLSRVRDKLNAVMYPQGQSPRNKQRSALELPRESRQLSQAEDTKPSTLTLATRNDTTFVRDGKGGLLLVAKNG